MGKLKYIDDQRGDGALPKQISQWGLIREVSFDIDLDGDDDLILFEGSFPPTPNRAYPIRIALNDGKGNFVEKTKMMISGKVPKFTSPSEVLFEDFNGDGRLDILVLDSGYDGNKQPGAKNQLLLGQTDGTYKLLDNPFGGRVTSNNYTTVGDIDGDGDLDVFEPTIGPRYSKTKVETANLWLNNGKGKFKDVSGWLPDYATGTFDAGDGTIYASHWIYASSLTDLNKDGRADLIVGPAKSLEDNTGQPAIVFWNNGKGRFSDSKKTVLPSGPWGTKKTEYDDFAAMDVNGDGKTDIIALSHNISNKAVKSGSTGYGVQVFINKGKKKFVNQTDKWIPAKNKGSKEGIEKLQIVDVEGDGDLDIVATGFGGGNPNTRPLIWLSNDKGVFDKAVYWKDIGSGPAPLVIVRSPEGNGYDMVTLSGVKGQPIGYGTTSATHDLTKPRTIEGTNRTEAIHGGKDRDTIKGGGGNDYIFGLAGQDTLLGNKGADMLAGGTGNDRLKGGQGKDVFVFKMGDGKDTITDFQNNRDTIRLDKKLWSGDLTKFQVIKQFASIKGKNVELNFGDGDKITILNFNTPRALADDIDFI